MKAKPKRAPELPLEGSCLCGAVQVKVTAPPLLTFACHCRDCQKFSASAYSLSAMFPADSVSVAGELKIGGRRTKERTHYFCPSCMNFIYSRITGADHRVNLRVSLLDDLSWFTPFVELMTEDKQDWANVPAERSFARMPQSLEELQDLLEAYAKS